MSQGSGRAGEFDERVLQGLDWVVAEAKRRRLLLLPCLLNYWDDYGGALWSEQRGAVCWRYQPRPSISCQCATRRMSQSVRRSASTLLIRLRKGSAKLQQWHQPQLVAVWNRSTFWYWSTPCRACRLQRAAHLVHDGPSVSSHDARSEHL